MPDQADRSAQRKVSETLTDREQRMLASAEEVIEAERRHIRPPNSEPVDFWGIGLSGGGIRAASMALGVLQSLAENDLLRRFQFISSVSGGGYIASSLQWWWSKGRVTAEPGAEGKPYTGALFGTGPQDFPYGPAHPDSASAGPLSSSDDKANENAPGSQDKTEPVPSSPHPKAQLNLSFLRAHSSYLTPGQGLNIWSMLGVVLRTVTISILTWLPLLTALTAVLLFIVDPWVSSAAEGLSLFAPFGPLIAPDWKSHEAGSPVVDFRYHAIFAVPLLLSYLSGAAFICAAVLFALVSRTPQDSTRRPPLIWPALAIAVVTALIIAMLKTFASLDASAVFLLAMAIVFAAVVAITTIVDRLTDPELNPSYLLRRSLETSMGRLFVPTLVGFAIGTIPLIPYYLALYDADHLANKTGTINVSLLTGSFSLAAGIASSLYGYYTFLRNIVPSLVGQIAATIGAILYIYATLVLAYALAFLLVVPKDFVSDQIAQPLQIGISAAIFLSAVIALRGNINFVGLHRFYRDRLMEAFMPSDASVAAMTAQFSPVADSLPVPALAPLSASGLPYPIINANAILINDPHRKYASRGGDNFIISPLFVGSTATGWQPTDDYIAKNGPLTLPSSMAASGAAASASAGYIGTGITMNRLVSAVMSLLNIRLGLWVGNPFHKQRRRVLRIPTFLNPGLVSGIFQHSHTHRNKYIELTDGGHFENLALYELVRRRLKVILIVDAEADPKISLASLVSATRRIEEDFGATLEFENGMGPAQLMMYPPERGYPADVRYATAPFMFGKLTYRHDVEKEGVLIYIKSTLIEQMDFTTAGYLASNPDFPHQSTVDQFFDPAQFDAYRCLGFESANAAIAALKLGGAGPRQPKPSMAAASKDPNVKE
jgi:hypothetical protein